MGGVSSVFFLCFEGFSAGPPVLGTFHEPVVRVNRTARLVLTTLKKRVLLGRQGGGGGEFLEISTHLKWCCSTYSEALSQLDKGFIKSTRILAVDGSNEIQTSQ